MHKLRTSSSRKRRWAPNLSIVKFPTCDLQKSGEEADICLNRDDGPKNLDATCEIRDSTCRFKLRCNRISKKWHCQKGEHIYTDVVCCNFICKRKR